MTQFKYQKLNPAESIIRDLGEIVERQNQELKLLRETLERIRDEDLCPTEIKHIVLSAIGRRP